MINYIDGQLTDLLPLNLIDEECKALSYALQKSLQQLVSYADKTRVFSMIDTMPGKVLDVLAQELKTMYYDEAFDIEMKRSIVKNTLLWHKKAGTPAAVEELVTTIFGSGKIVEWFDYNGLPGTFKIETSTQLTGESVDLLYRLIQKVKNTRSHLDLIVITDRVLDHKEYISIGCIQHTKIIIGRE